MPKNFTNLRQGVTIPQTPTVTSRPYVAKSQTGLTNKEKEARRLSKQANVNLPMNTSMATAGAFFSPQLSTDFLELPQSLREKREVYRHFYNTDPIVGQAIDLHTELPLSKVRLATPKPSTCPEGFKDAHDYASYILWFFSEMCDRIKLFQRMVTMVHHYWLDGSCVTPSTLISTPEGERRADAIRVGDRVLTHRGRWRAVENIYRQASQPVTALRIARLMRPLTVTGEHPIEILRGDNFEFVRASEVRPGDWVRATFPTQTRDVPAVVVPELLLRLDASLLYLMGCWFGAGAIRRAEWGLCFAGDDGAQRARAVDLLQGLFGTDSLRFDGTWVWLARYPLFAEAWSVSLGSKPERIPDWLMELPREKQLHLLAGIIDSAGRCGGRGLCLSFESDQLSYAVRDLLLRVGAVPSLEVSVGDHPGYRLWVDDRDEAEMVGQYAIKRRDLGQAQWVHERNGYRKTPAGVALLVHDVMADGLSDVVNFQVAEDSTFRAAFVSTHNCFIFAEDSTVEVPDEVGFEVKKVGKISKVTDEGETVEEDDVVRVPRPDRKEQELAYYQERYQGWSNLIVLPIDQVKITSYSFTDKLKVELIPAERDRALIEQAKAGDEFAQEMVNEIPDEVRLHMEQGQLIPLGTDPDEGSFVYYLSGHRGAGDELGQSILDRCLRVLVYREKLRQAQTQIASRAMTPKRVVWGDRISDMDVMDLREQVDLALVDPDYSIVANYEIHWEEMGARDRLLDLSSEYEITDKQLYAGLGVTESLLSGEALYSGDRLKLEVINTRYLFLREMLQEYVEKHLFKPVARRKGFVEKNQWGGEVVIYPKLSFTRLPLRDSQDTYDALFNLYNKGSIDISLILEMFNIDADDTRVKLEKDLFTVNDALFNELMRGLYGSIAQELVMKTDVTDRIIQTLGLKKVEPEMPAEDGRF